SPLTRRMSFSAMRVHPCAWLVVVHPIIKQVRAVVEDGVTTRGYTIEEGQAASPHPGATVCRGAVGCANWPLLPQRGEGPGSKPYYPFSPVWEKGCAVPSATARRGDEGAKHVNLTTVDADQVLRAGIRIFWIRMTCK